MRIITSTQWILALLLFFTSNFVTQAQTLDATFSSPSAVQCAGSLFTLNATTTTYQGYTWTIEGPNNFSSTISGSSSALNLTEPGTYNVSLSVTDGVTTETNTVSGFLNVATPATVNAGVDQTVCANTLVILNGTVGGSATSMSWSGGTGTFSTNSSQVTTYSPSPSEIGIVNLILTTNDPAGPCAAVSDTIMISFSSPPIVNAGVDQTICANAAVALNATVSGSATSISWSEGTGTFSTNSSQVTTYSPSPSEIAIGFVNLVITTNDPAGPCSAVSDTIMISFSSPPIANAGVDQTICANSFATLNGSFGGSASSASWVYLSVSGGTPGNFSNLLILNPTYTPSASDIANGFVNLILRTNDPAGSCSALDDTVMIIINQVPTIFSAPASICVGSTAQLSPSSGGIWTPSNVTRATINSISGLATGVSPGNVTFTFTSNATSCSNSTSTIAINSLPTVTAPTSICEGSTGQLSPSTGGTWISNITAIATVSNSGVVTTVSPGFVSFNYVSTATGCSATSSQVEIFGLPQVSAPSSVCLNATVQLSPNSGGTWVSSNPSIASITNAGLVTGLATGTVNFTFTNSTTGCANTTYSITVNPLPTVTLSANTVCVNGTVQVTPNFGGTWITYNSSVASVTSSGLVTGLAQGTTTIIFTNSTTGCSKTSENLNVGLGTNPVLSVPSAFCDGTTVQLLPSTGGTWTSNIPVRAVVTNNGIATGLSAGYVTFTYVNTVTGCSATSSQVQVYGLQQVSMPNSQLCVNSTMQLSPNSGGTWVSSNPNIASITNDGLVTCLSQGTVNFTFTNSTTGCVRTTNNLTVNPLPILNPIPDQVVCHNDFTQAINFTSSIENSTYNWNNNNSLIGLNQTGISPISSFQAQNTTGVPQIATITVNVSGNGCQNSINFSITVNPSGTVNPIPNQIVCAGELTTPITFSGSGQQYNWTNDNASIGLGASGTGNIAAFPSTTNTALINQVATITVTPISGSCNSTPTTFTITVKPIPTVFTPPNQTLCNNDSTLAINFSGPINGTDYNWTNSNSSIGYVNSGTGNIPSFQVQNTTFGSQIANFVVTPSLNGCLGSAINFDITVLPLPIVNAGNDTTLCFGESFTPIVTGNASTFIWNNGLVYNTPFTPTFTNTYTVIGSNNTCYNSDSITVTVNSVPQLTISTFDGEDTLACDGTLSVLVTDGTAPYSYTWTNGASNYTTSAIQDLCSGTYSLAVVDANGCSATNSATINDTLIENVLGDTLIFTDNIYQDSTIIGADTSAWIENCTFDYSLVTGATIDSYIDSGDSTIVTWIVALSTGSTVSVDATYFMSPGTTGVYDLTLQLYCSAKSGPKFLVASSRLYYEASSIGIQSLLLNSVFLYPNPTTSTLSISGINSDFSYKISDLQGKLLKQGANNKQIEIEHLPAGTYVIGISTDNEVKQLRFVKL